MKKWLLRIVYAALTLVPVGAVADYTATQGTGSTVFAFVCSTTKICPAMVLIDSTNVEKATAGNPLRTDPTGTTTQPVSAASLPLPAGASTSANQSSQLTQETATAAALGTTADAACATDNGTCTMEALQKRTNQNLTTLNTTAGNPIPAGNNIIGAVDTVVGPSASFTRPANVTAYAAGQLVANNTVAGSVTPMSFTVTRTNAGNGFIRRFRMTLSSKSITNTSFRLHLYTVSPTVTNGDGGTFLSTEANEFCTMNAIVSTSDPVNWTAGSDVSVGYGTPGQGAECNFVTAGGTTTVFGLLEARAAYTPASGETITVAVETHQNN